MQELFEGVWKIAPRFMSVVVILSIIFYVAYELASFHQKVDNMDRRLARVEQKVDTIIDYLLRGQSSQHPAPGK